MSYKEKAIKSLKNNDISPSTRVPHGCVIGLLLFLSYADYMLSNINESMCSISGTSTVIGQIFLFRRIVIFVFIV